MKHGEATVSAGKTAISCARAGAVAGILLVAGLLPLPLDAAIDSDEPGSLAARVVIDSEFPPIAAEDNDDVLPPAGDQIPTLAEDVPKVPQAPAKVSGPFPPSPSDGQSSEAAKDAAAKDLDETLWPPKELGLMDRVQDWLARANREFQFTIIRRLSTAPAGGGGDDIARKLEEVKEEDAEAAANRAEEAIKAAQAKQAAEARHQQELADTAEMERAKAPEPASAPHVTPKPDDIAALSEEMRRERERSRSGITAHRKAAQACRSEAQSRRTKASGRASVCRASQARRTGEVSGTESRRSQGKSCREGGGARGGRSPTSAGTCRCGGESGRRCENA